jgi:hypothetical protein
MNLSTKFNAVKTVVTSKVGQQALVASKNSPAILFGVGVVGVVATVVLASKATLKLEPIMDEFENEKQDRKLAHEQGTYPSNHYKQDMTLLHTKLVLDIGRVYAPAFVVGVVSIGALGGSHYVLTKRNAGLTAAYAALDKGFKQYRARVVEELGDEKDREFMFGSEEKELYVGEKKNGEPKIEKVKRAKGASVYAQWFDSTNSNYQKNAKYNQFFLRAQQDWLNDQLNVKGVVLLNDAYDSLGLDRTSAGAVVGWVKGSKGRDGFIDFGIWDKEDEDRYFDFMRGDEDAILLDFNVDGNVFEKIDELRNERPSVINRFTRSSR